LRSQGDVSVEEVIEWLLKGAPFVEYRTRVDLLAQSEKEPEVVKARKEMINQPANKLILQ
jgi:hypothetical protein